MLLMGETWSTTAPTRTIMCVVHEYLDICAWSNGFGSAFCVPQLPWSSDDDGRLLQLYTFAVVPKEEKRDGDLSLEDARNIAILGTALFEWNRSVDAVRTRLYDLRRAGRTARRGGSEMLPITMTVVQSGSWERLSSSSSFVLCRLFFIVLLRCFSLGEVAMQFLAVILLSLSSRFPVPRDGEAPSFIASFMLDQFSFYSCVNVKLFHFSYESLNFFLDLLARGGQVAQLAVSCSRRVVCP